jgi:hypothetical protein
MVAAWRQLSGYQHGRIYASLGGAHLSREFQLPGGTAARVTINDQDLTLATQHAALMLLWAVETHIARTTTEAPSQ